MNILKNSYWITSHTQKLLERCFVVVSQLVKFVFYCWLYFIDNSKRASFNNYLQIWFWDIFMLCIIRQYIFIKLNIVRMICICMYIYMYRSKTLHLKIIATFWRIKDFIEDFKWNYFSKRFIFRKRLNSKI